MTSTTTFDTISAPTTRVIIPIYSEVLGESIELLVPLSFIPVVEAVVAEKRTVYGPDYSRAITETLLDISRNCRWGNEEVMTRDCEYVILKAAQLVVDDLKAGRRER